MMNHRCGKQSAFTLIEMLGTVILATTALLMANRLSKPLSSAITRTNFEQGKLMRCTQLERMLRDDTWQATSLNVISPNEVRIDNGKQTLTWNIAADGSVTRTGNGPGEFMEWQRIAAKHVSFKWSNPSAIELVGFDDEAFTCVNQRLQLANWRPR